MVRSGKAANRVTWSNQQAQIGAQDEMFTVSSRFIRNFKLGDNINHNLKILSLLYRQFDCAAEPDKRLLCKPITILLVSIVEALLYDFSNTTEPVSRT